MYPKTVPTDTGTENTSTAVTMFLIQAYSTVAMAISALGEIMNYVPDCIGIYLAAANEAL